MALAAVGDGRYAGSGNINETMYLGRSSQSVQVGAATGLVGFYGVTPVVQRPYTAAVHATSAQASSTDFGATQLATLQEIMKTLIGLGIWATA